MLLPFFTWCESTALGSTIRASKWLFPVIESVHLLGLAVLGGLLLLVDMRLLGLGLRRQPAAQLAKDAEPWLIGSIVVMLLSGVALFLSESVKCYYSQPFWVKITAIPLAIVFTFSVRRKVALSIDVDARPLKSKLTALVSLLLWFTVAAGGRWIGFSG
jgi:hypothetical protein